MAQAQKATNNSPTTSLAPKKPSCVTKTFNRAHKEQLLQEKIELATWNYKYGKYHNSMPQGWQLAYKESKDNSENEEQETDIPVASTSSTIPSTPTTVPPTSTTPATIPHTSQPVKRMVPLVEQLFTPHPTVTSASNTSWNYKIPRHAGGDTQGSSDMPPGKRRLASEAHLDDIPATPCKFGPIIFQHLGLI